MMKTEDMNQYEDQKTRNFFGGSGEAAGADGVEYRCIRQLPYVYLVDCVHLEHSSVN